MHSALRLGMLSLRTKPISYRILPISLFFVLHMHPSPPCTLSMQVKHTADASHASQLYWVHDGPLLAYLGVAPDRGTFAPTVIRREAMLKEVTAISHEPGTWVGGWVGGWVGVLTLLLVCGGVWCGRACVRACEIHLAVFLCLPSSQGQSSRTEHHCVVLFAAWRSRFRCSYVNIHTHVFMLRSHPPPLQAPSTRTAWASCSGTPSPITSAPKPQQRAQPAAPVPAALTSPKTTQPKKRKRPNKPTKSTQTSATH